MTNHKIMVVDDNSATRRMVRNALVRNGHQVIEAPDGKTARELMRTEHPRVVLQDLMLPDIDGFVLVGELRELASSDVSILAFSGFVSKLDQARVSTVGFDDIITKPIAPSRLVPLIEAHLPVAVKSSEKFGLHRRLVVADDDPIQLKLATFRLARLGFEIEAVSDGASALAAIRRRRPDAVVSDVMMPELDGFGLAMALRQDPELRTVPLVLVTSSYVEASDRALARRAGANDLVLRTPDLAALIEALRDTLVDHADVAMPTPDLVPELERERNRRVFRQLERQVLLNTGLAKRCSSLASELTVLTGISEAVLQNRDIDVALDEAIASCFDAGGVAFGALYLLEGDAVRVRALGADIPIKQPIATFFGREALLRETIQSGNGLYINGGPGVADAAKLLDDANARAILVVPLSNTAGPLGALMMVSRERELDEADWRAFAQGVGMQISQVLTLARAYAALEAAERKAEDHAAVLQAVVDSAPDYVLQLDLDGRIAFMNRTVAPRLLDETLGTVWFDRLTVDERPRARAAFDAVIAVGNPVEIELHGIRADGTAGWYQTRMGVVKSKEQVATGVVIVAHDVTDKKHTDMQLMLADRMTSVGTLAVGLAHEINNPLAAVIANLDLAERDVAELGRRVQLPPDLIEEIRDALTSADRVREIVRDLKVFSRAQEDRRGAVDVKKVLESTLRMAQNELRHRAQLERNYGDVPRVDANEGRLGQVFLNLILNAIQAIPEGEYETNRVGVETRVDGDSVVIAISDTGSGIAPEVQRRLFTPFFTTKPAGIGTGLGLAISHRIITGLGGTLDFVTEVGKGTTFRVRLPIAPAQLAPITEKFLVQGKPVRRGRVLVIDDEDSLVQAIRRYMSNEHEVDGTTSPRKAIEMIAAGERYDAIVCDLMMPQVTGMDVHAAVLKIDPALADRMIFVTGGAFTERARAFLDGLEPGRHIDKPFDLKSLRALINEKL